MGKTTDPQELRMSMQTLVVLQNFLADVASELSGADISKCGHIASGTLYPILLRLESAGWLNSRWEKVDPSEVRRPRRRLYRLTGEGQRRATQVLSTFSKAVPA